MTFLYQSCEGCPKGRPWKRRGGNNRGLTRGDAVVVSSFRPTMTQVELVSFGRLVGWIRLQSGFRKQVASTFPVHIFSQILNRFFSWVMANYSDSYHALLGLPPLPDSVQSPNPEVLEQRAA